MDERPQPTVEQPQPHLNIDVNAVPFEERQRLMQEVKDLEGQLEKQVCVVDDGLMTIKGERVRSGNGSDQKRSQR